MNAAMATSANSDRFNSVCMDSWPAATLQRHGAAPPTPGPSLSDHDRVCVGANDDSFARVSAVRSDESHPKAADRSTCGGWPQPPKAARSHRHAAAGVGASRKSRARRRRRSRRLRAWGTSDASRRPASRRSPPRQVRSAS